VPTMASDPLRPAVRSLLRSERDDGFRENIANWLHQRAPRRRRRMYEEDRAAEKTRTISNPLAADS
jgi:hypothetical protein